MPVSDDYAKLSPSEILVSEARQRTDIDLDEGFLVSIKKRGVIMPLIVRRGDKLLIAGGRRLAAAKQVGLDSVPVRYTDEDIDAAEIMEIELEENIKRKELPWQNEASAIALLHNLYSQRDESWTKQKTSEQLGIGPVHLWLRVAKALSDPQEREKIANAAGMRAAYNICERIDSRHTDAVLEEITSYSSEMFGGVVTGDEIDSGEAVVDNAASPDAGSGKSVSTIGSSAPAVQRTTLPQKAAVPPSDVLCLDFMQWAQTYSGPRFNFIHCDFPYGKKVFGGEWGGKNAEAEFQYDDDPDIYWKLCLSLCMNLDRLMTPSAHLMFWTSSDIVNLYRTIEFFREHAPSLIFQPRALTWHKSDNVGIVPDPLRGPRWIVETALMATRGDRPLVKPLASSYSAPTARALHPSTKPEPVLRHFFGMFVDTTTRMLDPTCGSGSALRAAESLGAEVVLGIERSQEFTKSAENALRAFRNLRELTQ